MRDVGVTQEDAVALRHRADDDGEGGIEKSELS